MGTRDGLAWVISLPAHGAPVPYRIRHAHRRSHKWHVHRLAHPQPPVRRRPPGRSPSPECGTNPGGGVVARFSRDCHIIAAQTGYSGGYENFADRLAGLCSLCVGRRISTVSRAIEGGYELLSPRSVSVTTHGEGEPVRTMVSGDGEPWVPRAESVEMTAETSLELAEHRRIPARIRRVRAQLRQLRPRQTLPNFMVMSLPEDSLHTSSVAPLIPLTVFIANFHGLFIRLKPFRRKPKLGIGEPKRIRLLRRAQQTVLARPSVHGLLHFGIRVQTRTTLPATPAVPSPIPQA